MKSFEIFLTVVSRYSDLKWGDFRDDLIVKSAKVLRKFRDGKGKEDVLSDRKLSQGIEEILDSLKTFADSSEPDDVNRVIDSLLMFTKAPAPCKMKIISLLEVMLGKAEAKG